MLKGIGIKMTVYKIWKSQYDVEREFILTIKNIRSITGMGLEEAKDLAKKLRYKNEPFELELTKEQVKEFTIFRFTVTKKNSINIEIDDSVF
jgi:hypothetical protein